MKRNIKMTLILGTVIALLTGFTSFSAAGGDVRLAELKILNIQPVGARPQGFDVTLTPVKPVFEVGEPIKFKIKGNKRFYLYLFSIDNNRAVLLLPGSLQKKGNMYYPNRVYTVPNPKVEMFGAQPGLEKVIMVASTKWLNLDSQKYVKSGDFFTTEEKEVEDWLKTLRVRQTGSQEDVLTKELDLVIAGRGQRFAPQPNTYVTPTQPQAFAGDEDSPIPFVSTARDSYRLGDQVKIIFGADREGFVSLYQIEPNGKRTLLKKQAVSGKSIYHVYGMAAPPAGRHTLVSVFSPMEKGILIMDEKQRPQAVHYLDIH